MDSQQITFDNLKQTFCEKPVLKYPDFTKHFTLTTDASNKGLRVVLNPCCYISRTLNAPEKNYGTTKKELLAIVWEKTIPVKTMFYDTHESSDS